VVTQARRLAALSRAPRDHLARHRRDLHQSARELRAVSARRLEERIGFQTRVGGTVLGRKIVAALAGIGRDSKALRGEAASLDRAAARLADRRRETLDRLAAAIDTRDPQRTLERGYALVEDAAGEPVTAAAAARAQPALTLRLHDGRVRVRPDPSEPALPWSGPWPRPTSP
jgi:exodeoxyribonuclease VII large subunit